MKFPASFLNAIVIVALVACLSRPSATAREAVSLDVLLAGTFPDKAAHHLNWSDFQQLTLTQRNQLAVAATREFSLRTTGGTLLTTSLVDALLHKHIATDTPEDAALRQLHYDNERRVRLLRDVSESGPITDQQVIGPLVDMLDYPGRDTFVASTALGILRKLTRINCGDDFQQGRDRSAARRRQVVEWWRAWWKANQDKHPIVDSELEQRLKAQVSIIQLQLREDFKDYGEMRRFDPDQIRIHHEEPLVDIAIGTMLSSEGFIRTGPDGTFRLAKPEERIFVRILARFQTPPLSHQDGPRYENWTRFAKTPIVEVVREILAGTDILIMVEAASEDGEFMRRIKESMRRLPPAPTSDDGAVVVGAAETRPQPEDVKEFVADPIPSDDFKDLKVTQKDLESVLKDYFQVEEDHWKHGYSHLAFGDRAGHFILKDGRKVKWMVKPGGLAWLEFPSGKKMFLANEK